MSIVHPYYHFVTSNKNRDLKCTRKKNEYY